MFYWNGGRVTLYNEWCSETCNEGVIMPQALEQRRSSAAERQAAADLRTPQQQLARLDHMYGKGQGAAKERAKLAEKIAKAKAKPVETTEPAEHVAEAKDEKKARKRRQKAKE